jgi:endo-1,4-beta-xylanase
MEGNRVNEKISRRAVLGGAAAGGAMLALPARAQASDGLHALAKAKGLRFGSAVAWGAPGADRGSFANPAYAALLERECGMLVPENELKWQWTRPAADKFDFRQFDGIVDYAVSKNMPVRGHTLFWTPDKWYPEWLKTHDFGSQPRAAAEKMLAGHVQTVARRYGTKIVSYDVVNEAIDPETGRFRDTNVVRAFGSGEAMIDLMFHTAKAEAPHAELVYNDYMSWEHTGEDERHMAGVLKLLEGFRKRGTPVDALGVQSHIRLLETGPVAGLVAKYEKPWRRFIDEVVAMGYKLVLTEIDVNDKKAPGDLAVRDRMVADYAKAYLDIMLSYPQLKDLLVWGMSDRYTWLSDFDARADKLPKRALPYDAKFQPTGLRGAIAAAIAGAPSRA